MTYTPILGTLGYVMSPDQKQTLMLYRNKYADDHYFGRYIGLGGKLEPGEDIVSGIRREIYEESGLECEDIVLRGTVSWLDLESEGSNWFGFIFRIDSYKGEPYIDNREGTLTWVSVEDVFRLPVGEGDHLFLPMVFDDHSQQFHGVMTRKGNEVLSWKYNLIAHNSPYFDSRP